MERLVLQHSRNLHLHLSPSTAHLVLPADPELDGAVLTFPQVHDLGAGAFGTVMLMRHKKDQRPIALKCLMREAITKTTHKEHVLSEKPAAAVEVSREQSLQPPGQAPFHP